ncbi:T9SS type A sorting domain-containing protein [Ferruginibacter sp. SUN106]|uniref:T9SS type A sorting domain-containing protein n=1 Tax=Ferruginibacter sp. SUN106 TaxID=2978348 RepID=UPI003D35FF9A
MLKQTLKIALAILCACMSIQANAQSCTFANQTVSAANTVLNTYYPGNASITAGATSITLGAATGAATTIAAGDMVLIMQMQEATQNSTNTTSYGDGVAGAPASGYLVSTAGTYEFAIAISAVPLAGGTLNLLTGTTNAYNNAAATATQGKIVYQVIRVPRYNNLTINAATSITATKWNGTTGGIVALDVNGTLNMNTTGSINANAAGFRGGGGRQLGGGGGANTDIRTNATVNTNGAKGEGICGTPRYVYDGTALVNTGVEGYPNGSNSNGAPGNAGGGGADADPANNDENTGGGGGANGGAGGRGGRSWNSNLNVGGYGGVAPAFLASSRIILGGGGGAGSTNDGTGALAAGLSSSGGTGGGIVLLKVNTITNAGTISANGSNGGSVDNDGGGGGGAGGTVYVTATVTASLATLTINTIGGNGGNAWPTIADAGAANDGNPEHGPGGGGAGGMIYTNGAIVAGSSVAGGSNGITTTSNLAFGATGGTGGVKTAAAAAITLPALTTPVAGSNTPVCAGNNLNLTGTPTIATATYAWTGPNTFSSASQNPTITAATTAATGTYNLNYTLGACVTATVTTPVTVTAAPTTANAGPDQGISYGAGISNMAGNTAVVGTGLWSQVSGPVTANILAPSSRSTTITGMTTSGVYVFQWTITNGTCVSSDQMVVNATTLVPVKWLMVQAQLNSQKLATITWRVQEQSITAYEVQRSADGLHFITTGTVSSNGDGENSYSFTESSVLSGLRYYRIKQTDKDGRISYSDMLKLKDNTAPGSLSVYPNPTSGQTSLSLSVSKQVAVQYQVTDASGKVVLQGNKQFNAGTTIMPLLLDKFAAGIYYVQVKADAFVLNEKIIKL